MYQGTLKPPVTGHEIRKRCLHAHSPASFKNVTVKSILEAISARASPIITYYLAEVPCYEIIPILLLGQGNRYGVREI
jgi:hypothetical protein